MIGSGSDVSTGSGVRACSGRSVWARRPNRPLFRMRGHAWRIAGKPISAPIGCGVCCLLTAVAGCPRRSQGLLARLRAGWAEWIKPDKPVRSAQTPRADDYGNRAHCFWLPPRCRSCGTPVTVPGATDSVGIGERATPPRCAQIRASVPARIALFPQPLALPGPGHSALPTRPSIGKDSSANG